MKPFSLWLGSWWVEEATRGKGICPGGKIPFVSVTQQEAKAGVRVSAAARVDSSTATGAGAGADDGADALDEIPLSKYEKMLKIGMAIGAVEQRMTQDGVPKDRVMAFSAAASAA